MIENNNTNYKKVIGGFMLLGLVAGLIIGVTLGIELYQVVSNKLGFWEGNVEATHIAIFLLKHQIQSSSKIKTTIGMGNTGVGTIHCNCTLYYKDALSEHLATYSFNATINAEDTYNKMFEVSPINVSRWAGTDVSIFEY